MTTTIRTTSFAWLDRSLLKAAVAQAFAKLDPRVQWRNPVMFVVYTGSVITTLLWIDALKGHGEAPAGFILAVAGSLAAKKRIAATSGTMPTHGALFIVLLVGTVLLVGLLNYVPALALGPAIEHLTLWK